MYNERLKKFIEQIKQKYRNEPSRCTRDKWGKCFWTGTGKGDFE